MTWVIMPVMAGIEMTRAAINDVLAQSVPVRLLVINQGCPDEMRAELERISEEYSDRVFLWSHEPPLLSLAASWNRALDFVWGQDATEALVVNNDVRLRPDTVEWLSKIRRLTSALFVTAVGVRAEQFNPTEGLIFPDDPDAEHPQLAKGGPDFSCFLISKDCHERWRFDEQFIPAYCEDLDYHRRLMLDGHGEKIFSVNLPYLHLAAQTLKQVDPQRKMRIDRSIETGSRAYYQRKWGGPVNHETFYAPFDEGHELDKLEWQRRCGPTTPEIQNWVQTPYTAVEQVIRPHPMLPPPESETGVDKPADEEIPF